jgi:four helix bundle suffix protein
MNTPSLLPAHGGYRRLKSFQVAELVYDITVRFCERYISKFSRTRDQMVQAARSGVQNIAEGSQASGTSKKTELKLTGVARASLEELHRDYEDFLRQRNLVQWKEHDPRRDELITLRPKTADDVALWIQHLHDAPSPSSPQLSYAEISANAALTLTAVAMSLLSRQIKALSDAFLKEGGFTERLYRMRSEARKNQ